MSLRFNHLDLDELKRLLDKILREEIEDIYINYLKPIKKDFYECAAKCCDEKLDFRQYGECYVNCYMKTTGANYYIISTFNDFKRRLKTCVRKCDNGSGYDVLEDDDEGPDDEITAEDLKEHDFGDDGNKDLLEDYFDDLNSDLEDERKKVEPPAYDFKDKEVCSRLCIESYLHRLQQMTDDMRQDLCATFLSKSPMQGFYYDWSRTYDPFLGETT